MEIQHVLQSVLSPCGAIDRLWDKRVRISDMEYRNDRLRLGQLCACPRDEMSGERAVFTAVKLLHRDGT